MKEKINQIIKNSFKESINLKSEILNSNLINQIGEVGQLLINCGSDSGGEWDGMQCGPGAESVHNPLHHPARPCSHIDGGTLAGDGLARFRKMNIFSFSCFAARL